MGKTEFALVTALFPTFATRPSLTDFWTGKKAENNTGEVTTSPKLLGLSL
ncbi:hypothetical protein [Rhizobium leguminosarum]|nr:hypothetical protein [Rhizobium leguminosarum]